MASVRAHARIDRPASDVWEAVTDPTGIASWFPGVDACALEGDIRTVTTSSGFVVKERVVTNDSDLRRFQYSLVDLPGIESHMATIDVIEDGAGTIAVYAADVVPDAAGTQMQESVSAAVNALKAHVEKG